MTWGQRLPHTRWYKVIMLQISRMRNIERTVERQVDGIPDDKTATIIAGQRPGDLTREEAVAYDMASALWPAVSCRR